jgi:spore coat polysaccharide biosynthesis protein SpsF (cytidylyltransferase family)
MRPAYRLCVDHPEDFEVITRIYAQLYPGDPTFSARDVIRLLDGDPELARRNTGRADAFECPRCDGELREEVMALDGR